MDKTEDIITMLLSTVFQSKQLAREEIPKNPCEF